MTNYKVNILLLAALFLGVPVLLEGMQRSNYKPYLQRQHYIQQEAIYDAAYRGDVRRVYELLQKGADINQYDPKTGNSVLHIAVLRGDTGFVDWLISNGSLIDAKESRGSTPLMLAALEGHAGMVRLLLDRGAQVNMHNKRYQTALMAAAANGDKNIVELLLDRGALIDLHNNSRETALMAAAAKGYRDIVELLLDRGASIDLQIRRKTALMFAAQQGHTVIAWLLLKRGASIDLQNEKGQTALMFAAQNGHMGTVRLLLENDASIDVQTEQGQTALMMAVINGHVDIVRLLLDWTGRQGGGAQINLQDKVGQTALMLAVINERTDIVRLLLDRGANTNLLNRRGQTVLDIVNTMRGAGFIGELVRRHGGRTARELNQEQTQQNRSVQTSRSFTSGTSSIGRAGARREESESDRDGNGITIRVVQPREQALRILEGNIRYPAFTHFLTLHK